MEKFDKILEKVIHPPRSNFSNLLYTQSKYFTFFTKSEFTLHTFDQLSLPCIFFQNKNTNSSTIIYTHSFGSCKYEGSSLLEQCSQKNLNLCLYDSRASGEASGGQVYFGFNEKIDLLFLLLKLNFSFRCGNFILWGRSIGCNCILQLYQTLIQHESSFLNALVRKQQERQKERMKQQQFQKNIIANFPRLLPENFNKFIYQYFQTFLFKNVSPEIYQKFQDFKIGFKIEGIVLDSPYTSFDEFIEDNIKRFVPFLPGLLISPLSSFLKNWFDKKLQINLNKKQNIDIIQVTNLNTTFIVSDLDEMIPETRFQNFGKDFALKCPKKNKPFMRNCHQKHGAKRPAKLMDESIGFLLQNRQQINCYLFRHDQKIQKTDIPQDMDFREEIEEEDSINLKKNFEKRKSIEETEGGKNFIQQIDKINIEGIINQIQMDQKEFQEENEIQQEQTNFVNQESKINEENSVKQKILNFQQEQNQLEENLKQKQKTDFHSFRNTQQQKQEQLLNESEKNQDKRRVSEYQSKYPRNQYQSPNFQSRISTFQVQNNFEQNQQMKNHNIQIFDDKFGHQEAQSEIIKNNNIENIQEKVKQKFYNLSQKFQKNLQKIPQQENFKIQNQDEEIIKIQAPIRRTTADKIQRSSKSRNKQNKNLFINPEHNNQIQKPQKKYEVFNEVPQEQTEFQTQTAKIHNIPQPFSLKNIIIKHANFYSDEQNKKIETKNNNEDINKFKFY